MSSPSVSAAGPEADPAFPVAGFHGEDGTHLNLVFAGDVSPVGIYANGAVAWTNASDLVIDFFVSPMAPDDQQATVVARIRLPPAMAGDFVAVLTRQFEQGMQHHGGQQ